MEKRNLLLLFQISVHQQCYEKLAMWGSAVEKEEILSTHRSEGDTEIGQRILVSLHERIACSLPSRKHCRAHWASMIMGLWESLLWSNKCEWGGSMQQLLALNLFSADGESVCPSQAQAVQLPGGANRGQSCWRQDFAAARLSAQLGEPTSVTAVNGNIISMAWKREDHWHGWCAA